MALVAKQLGFVDELLTDDELRQKLVGYVGADEDGDPGYNAAGLDDYLAQARLLEGPGTRAKNVAVVVASGEILNGSQPPGTITPTTCPCRRSGGRASTSHSAV